MTATPPTRRKDDRLELRLEPAFVLPADRLDGFVERLERDERPMPGLAAFLARPSILDEA